jgi:hypothetical protein
VVLHARCITLPNPKRGEQNQIQASNGIGNFLVFFIHEFINVIIWGPLPYTRGFGGGDPSDTLAIWMGIKPMPTRHNSRGMTTRHNNEFYNPALEDRFYGIETMEFDEFGSESGAHRILESSGF